MTPKDQRRDSWVLWLTGIFALIALTIFTFAIIRHRLKTKKETPTRNQSVIASSQTASPGEFRIVRVIDGDSVIVVGSDGIDLSIRLRGIDAPELGQPYGLEAKQALQALLKSASISLDNPQKGKYGRYVADVFVGDVWINERMVADGHAWCDQGSSTETVLQRANQKAKKNELGLWSLPDPVPPWTWRAEKR